MNFKLITPIVYFRLLSVIAILFFNVDYPIFAQIADPSIDQKRADISIYSGDYKKHGQLYNWMWGKHYRSLYYTPVNAQKVNMDTWLGGMLYIENMPRLYGLLFADENKRYYLLKILGAPTSFVESSFFREIYNKEIYKNTYLGDFIQEAATIENPFGFLISDNLARKIELNTGDITLVEIQNDYTDTIFDGVSINNKLASIYRLPDLDTVNIETDTDILLHNIHSRKGVLDHDLYIRTRLFDMLIGDWNKIPENWGWESTKDTLENVYKPMVLDRSHAFTKVDGVFFKRLLGMLSLGFITNYNAKAPNVSKVNKLGYTLDMALTANSSESDWVGQAHFIQSKLTDSLIDQTFSQLPLELQNNTFEKIKYDIKMRRDVLDKTATKYYKQLQKTPVLVAQDADVFVESVSDKNLRISFIDKIRRDTVFDKIYSPAYTQNIWLYTLGNKTDVKIDKKFKAISLSLINTGEPRNYKIDLAANTRIYAPQSEKGKLQSLKGVKTILSKDTSVLTYNYQKYQYSKFSLTPIGVYDSDLGLNIGTSAAYTLYGIRRKPFTSQHQLSYNYSSGFLYQGIFPLFSSNSSFHLLAFASNNKSFYNFFGMGNNTSSFKDNTKNYNRVHYNKYFITPSFNHQISRYQDVNTAISFQYFKIKDSVNKKRYINTVYQSDNDIFKKQYYIDLNVTYSYQKKINNFFSNLSLEFNPGWIIDLLSFENNVPYASLDVGLDLKLTNRLTLVTLLKGKALFSNNYKFYQAATTDLRGFRSNRFIGKQSFYECSDLRLDMGRLENPLTPLSYGLFVGADHGRVWYPAENSDKWHTSYGGGFWLTIFKEITGKFSYFVTKEHENRFLFELGMSF